MAGQNSQPQTSCNTKTPNIEPYYNYKPIRKGRIRLVRIEPSCLDLQEVSTAQFEDDLHVSIEEYSLQSCPSYIALSYTWDNATAETDPTTLIFTSVPRCYPIYCEGRFLRVTQNLRQALRRLRYGSYASSVSPYEHGDFKKDALRNIDSYWIDAICIDQDDISERSEQVQLMSRIYGQARCCVAYLGDRDESSVLALEAVDAFLNDKVIAQRFDQRMARKVGNNVVYRMESLPDTKKNALSLLLTRRYFSRVWCLQEIVLPRKIVGMLGPLVFDFEMLTSFGYLMQFASEEHTIKDLNTFTTGTKRLPAETSNGRGPYDVAMSLGTIHQTRSSCRGGEPVGLSSGGCNDRDRIYGIVALSDELRCNDEPAIPVDYQLTVEEVYVNATVALCRRRNDLEFLHRVGDHKCMKIQSLPSWCPDYSNRNFCIRFPSIMGGQWHVGSFWNSPPNISFQDSRLLVAHGIRYDGLAGTATSGLSASSRISRSARPSRVMELTLNSHQADYQQAGSRTRITRVEMLWRLLLMDEFLEQRPAAPVMALFLPSLIVYMFQHHFNLEWSRFPAGEAPADPLMIAERDALEHVVGSLGRLEPESMPFLPDISGFKDLMASSDDCVLPHKALMESLPRRAADAGLTSELYDLLPATSCSTLPNKTPRNLLLFLSRKVINSCAAGLSNHSYFSTARTGRLGIGYSSIEVNDEVWLLNGHSAPVILRQLPNGNYRFLGETYIQGMMNGELAEELKAADHPVKRIQIE